VADGLIAPPGLTPLTEGREAQVFVRADGNVVKVMRSADQEPRVRREAAALQALADRRHLAPAFVETTEVAGRPALVTERVSGDDLLARLSKKPWLVLKVAGTLGRAHAAMHEHPAPDSLPDLRDELARRIESAKALPEHHATAALERLRALPTGDRLCHGDCHPQNVLGTLKDPVIIDWGDASRGAPAADVGRTLLLLRMGELPPDTPAPMRALTAVGRGMLARRYLAVYRRHAIEKPSQLDDWLFVRAAARFNEELEMEYPRLLKLLAESPRTATP
jgi:aminoglycoside phosphotransferase (APT) family kinase protein